MSSNNCVRLQSYNASDRYIAAQNPDETSSDLFWRMVLDNDVDVIVALGQVCDLILRDCRRYSVVIAQNICTVEECEIHQVIDHSKIITAYVTSAGVGAVLYIVYTVPYDSCSSNASWFHFLLSYRAASSS